MRKYGLYIIMSLLLVAVLILFLTNSRHPQRRFNERITMRVNDKIPYGAYIAYHGLQSLFPEAGISISRKGPGLWDSLSAQTGGQALIVITPEFNADEQDMQNLIHFVEGGNDVFISTMNLSYEALQAMNCDMNSADGLMYYFENSENSDPLSVSLARPPFDSNRKYSYPGKRFDFYFYKLDSTTVTVLGHDKYNHPNFIHLKAGEGNLFVHLAPLTFSNYFLLHRNNMAYYENVLSVISPGVKQITWDEYFLGKRRNQEKDPNWLSMLFQHPSLKWALLTALIALILYVLSEMRRKQRVIPIVKRPVNDSLEFVKTIGRLYHDRGDHYNLSRKMAAYFMEHVRSRYQLTGSEPDEEFIRGLHARSEFPEPEIREIVSFIRNMDVLSGVSEKQLARFHNLLERFYAQA